MLIKIELDTASIPEVAGKLVGKVEKAANSSIAFAGKVVGKSEKRFSGVSKTFNAARKAARK